MSIACDLRSSTTCCQVDSFMAQLDFQPSCSVSAPARCKRLPAVRAEEGQKEKLWVLHGIIGVSAETEQERGAQRSAMLKRSPQSQGKPAEELSEGK